MRLCVCVLLVLVANNSKALSCVLANCFYASDLTFSHKSFFGCTNACIRHKFRNYIISRKCFFDNNIQNIFYAYSIYKSLSIYSENPFDRTSVYICWSIRFSDYGKSFLRKFLFYRQFYENYRYHHHRQWRNDHVFKNFIINFFTRL